MKSLRTKRLILHNPPFVWMCDYLLHSASQRKSHARCFRIPIWFYSMAVRQRQASVGECGSWRAGLAPLGFDQTSDSGRPLPVHTITNSSLSGRPSLILLCLCYFFLLVLYFLILLSPQTFLRSVYVGYAEKSPQKSKAYPLIAGKSRVQGNN